MSRIRRTGNTKRSLNLKTPDGGRVKFNAGESVVEVENPDHVAFVLSLGGFEKVEKAVLHKPSVPKTTDETEGAL